MKPFASARPTYRQLFLVLNGASLVLFAVGLAHGQVGTATTKDRAAVKRSEAANGVSSPLPSARPWTNPSLLPEQRADLLLEQMTLDEKIVMMHGVKKGTQPVSGYVGYVLGNRRLGIPALAMADGRAGVGNHARDVTLLPAPVAAASSWDTDLMNRYGTVLGQEERTKGTNVTLAPTIDVVRVPEWGRTFESYSEDPYLNGRMATAEIQGIQSQGTIANANMYLTMNQESNRHNSDSIVDERTLQEIYLRPFEAAIREGHAGSIMCAYVKTNGFYSCENAHLLQDVLRKQLNFNGWVMSDWGATHSTVDAANHGLDQQMPNDKYFGQALKEAVLSGRVSVGTVDTHVRRILATMFRYGLFDQPQTGAWNSNARTPEHDAFSRTVAEEGTVLLKNDNNILPLSSKASVAVIGKAGSLSPKVEGGGSSGVVAPYMISPLDGLRKRAGDAGRISYADGSDLNAAAKAARAADVAIVFVHTDEREGRDRADLELPDNQDQLITTVAEANKRTIVVLDTGGPVLMPWIGRVAGILEAWFPGQEDGNAIAAILYGDVNPSAKLPLTFPRTAAEIPTAREDQWPGVNGRSLYSERLNVGYRWYDANKVQPLFPFGFGLSYTAFRLSKLKLSPKRVNAASGAMSKEVDVKLDVTNTGERDGAEIVQVYVEQPAKNGEPPRQLRAFQKIQLKAKETKPVTLKLDERSFSIYDPNVHSWIAPKGKYTIFVGTSSRDLPLHASVTQ